MVLEVSCGQLGIGAGDLSTLATTSFVVPRLELPTICICRCHQKKKKKISWQIEHSGFMDRCLRIRYHKAIMREREREQIPFPLSNICTILGERERESRLFMWKELIGASFVCDKRYTDIFFI